MDHVIQELALACICRRQIPHTMNTSHAASFHLPLLFFETKHCFLFYAVLLLTGKGTSLFLPGFELGLQSTKQALFPLGHQPVTSIFLSSCDLKWKKLSPFCFDNSRLLSMQKIFQNSNIGIPFFQDFFLVAINMCPYF